MDKSYGSGIVDDPEFQALLVTCLEALERGEPVDAEQLASDYPQYASEFGRFLEGRQSLREAAELLGPSAAADSPTPSQADTLPPDATADEFFAGDSLRYIGEYQILSEIARGGMGIVFRARQQSLGRIVALKMILAGRLADASDVQRFQREAQAAARLKHPGIVPVHEIGEYAGRHYFTMDFVEGCSLAEAIREETLPPRKTAELVRAAAEAVDYAHRQGTVHRDLKPSNVLLDVSGRPLITDFGVARVAEPPGETDGADLTASGQIVGTPSYMSPEQAAGNRQLVGPASDVYSLGAILYACLTGRAPFVADTPVDTLLQVLQREPVPPGQLNPSVPTDLETICLKCLSKEPHGRYSTAQALADDLQRFIEGRPVTARPVGMVSKSLRWCRRNPLVSSLLSAIAVILTAGAAISTFFAVAEHRQSLIASDARALAEHQRDAAEQERDAADRARATAQQRGRELRRQLYAAQMSQAQRAWEEGNIHRMRKLLDAQRPRADEQDLRGFEWRYLSALVHPEQREFDAPTSAFDAVCDPDGEWIATLSQKQITVQDLDNGRMITALEVEPGRNGRLAVSAGSPLLAGGHRRLRTWNTSARRLLWQSEEDDQIADLAFSADGLSLAVVRHISGAPVSTAIRIRDAHTGTVRRTILLPTEVWSVAFDPSGKRLAGTCHDGKLRIWDLESGRELAARTSPPLATAVAWSPDGQRIAYGDDGSIQFVRVFHADSNRLLAQWKHFESTTTHLAFDHSGERLIVGGASQIVYVLNIPRKSIEQTFRGHEDRITGVAFRPGRREAVSTDGRGVTKVWHLDVEPGLATLNRFETFGTDAAFSPSGDWLACSEGAYWERETPGAIQLWNTTTGQTGPRLKHHTAGVFGVEFFPDDRRLISVGADGMAVIWSLETFEPLTTLDAESPLRCVDLALDGRLAVTGAGNGQVIVWDPEQGTSDRLQMFADGWVTSVAVSPDGGYLAACCEAGSAVWDLHTKREVLSHTAPDRQCVAFSHSGSRLAFGGQGRVDLYETSFWQKVGELLPDSGQVVGLSFDSSDERLITRSFEGVVRLWDIETLQPTLKLKLNRSLGTDPHPPVLSPDGTLLVAGRREKQFHIWSTRGPFTTPPAIEPDFFVSRGKTRALHQRWSDALEDFELALQIRPEDRRLRVHATTTAAMLEEPQRYLAHARKSLELAQTQPLGAVPAGRLVRAACLRSGVTDDYSAAVRIARRVWNGKHDFDEGTGVLWALYRAGQFEELRAAAGELQSMNQKSSLPRHFESLALLELDQMEPGATALEQGFERLKFIADRAGHGRPLKTKHFDWVVASVLAAREADKLAVGKLNQTLADSPDNRNLLLSRARLHHRWQRWKEAAADFRRAAELDPNDLRNLELTATTSLAGGDAETWADFSARLESRVADPELADRAWAVTRICSLAPGRIEDYSGLIEATRQSAERHPRHWWRQIALVAVLSRAGALDEASLVLNRVRPLARNWKHRAVTLLWQALIDEERGDLRNSRRALDEAERLAEANQPPPGMPSHGDIGLAGLVVLRREAASRLSRAVVEKQSPESNRPPQATAASRLPQDRHFTEQLEQIRLDGRWLIEEALIDGIPVEPAQLGDAYLQFSVDRMELHIPSPPGFPPRKPQSVSYELDLESSPRSIDILSASADGSEVRTQGIYEFRDGRLRLAFADPDGGSRPDGFVSAEAERAEDVEEAPLPDVSLSLQVKRAADAKSQE